MKIIDIKKKITPLLQKNDVIEAGIFGSFARKENKKDSDIDLIIKFKGKKSLLDLASLELKLEKKLKKKVDIVTYKSINLLLKKRILNEEIKIIKDGKRQ